jgi:broad specificity phosphatase PhoE
MRLILLRHAETEENRKGIVQGQKHGKISELGKSQIKTAVISLKNEPIDALFSSDLQRCIDTAEPLRLVFSKVPYNLSSDLREFSYGRLQGLPLGRFIKIIPKFSFILHLKLPGGESYKQVKARLTRFLNQLYEIYPNGTVLIITHGGPIRIMRLLLDKNVKPTTPQIINNCSVWRLTMSGPIKNA